MGPFTRSSVRGAVFLHPVCNSGTSETSRKLLERLLLTVMNMFDINKMTSNPLTHAGAEITAYTFQVPMGSHTQVRDRRGLAS